MHLMQHERFFEFHNPPCSVTCFLSRIVCACVSACLRICSQKSYFFTTETLLNNHFLSSSVLSLVL